MSLNRKIPKILIALLFIVFVAFLAWMALRGQTNSSKPPSTFTVVPTNPRFVVKIPEKALLKNYVTVSVEAAPGTKCRLTFVPPSGGVQTTDKIADKNGLCEWRWKLEESQGKGYGRLIFTINGISETHFLEIHSAF